MDLPGVQQNVRLAPLTTYQIGGPADWFVEVATSEELIAAIAAAQAARMPYFILGTGANILMSDAGFRGLVIHNRANQITIDTTSGLITADSGATMAEVIEAATAAGLGGLEYFTLIPSSVGGAVRQNLHFVKVDAAHWEATGELKNGETQYLGDRVVEGVIWDAAGGVRRVNHDWFDFHYDYSRMLDEPVVLLQATFRGQPRATAEITRQAAATTAWRRAKQPQLDEVASCGSVFMKIEGVGAGRLIDQAGLKGATEGRIQVSPKHANYLVNLGGGTAQEVRRLIERVQREVLTATGYHLEPEVNMVGDWS